MLWIVLRVDLWTKIIRLFQPFSLCADTFHDNSKKKSFSYIVSVFQIILHNLLQCLAVTSKFTFTANLASTY